MPPAFVFAPVWATLYASIGVSAWLVWRRMDVAAHRKRAALLAWGWQLGANAVWPPVFFGLHAPGAGFLVLTVLLVAVAVTIRAFWRLDRAAALLLVPYFGWCCFATYLDVGFWRLNGG